MNNNPLQCDQCIVGVTSQLKIIDSRNEVEGVYIRQGSRI